jgi:magnesium transporter
LISFQEKRSDFLFISENESVTIQETSGQKKVDFFFVLLDAIIENFYITIETEEDGELINLSKNSADQFWYN